MNSSYRINADASCWFIQIVTHLNYRNENDSWKISIVSFPSYRINADASGGFRHCHHVRVVPVDARVQLGQSVRLERSAPEIVKGRILFLPI
jgi:hypothetical protein